jgi:hypothetical protein
MGAPQLGHFRDVTPEGARMGELEDVGGVDELDVAVGLVVFNPVFVPHLGQNVESSGI